MVNRPGRQGLRTPCGQWVFKVRRRREYGAWPGTPDAPTGQIERLINQCTACRSPLFEIRLNIVATGRIDVQMANAIGKSAMPLTHRHPIGILRREFLQVGFSGLLGLGLPDLMAMRGRAAAASPGGSKREAGGGTDAAGEIGDPGLPDGRAEPHRLLRHEAGVAGRDPGRVPADRDRGPRDPLLRAPAPTGRAGRQAGGRPVALACLHEPPQRDPRDPDGPPAAGGLLRQDRLARRLSVLCLGGGRDPASGRRDPQRGVAADLPHGRAR